MNSGKLRKFFIASVLCIGLLSFFFLNTHLANNPDIQLVCPAEMNAEEQVLPDAEFLGKIIKVAIRYIPTLVQ